jgi:hypothetical protein
MNAPFPSACVNQGVWIKTVVFTSSGTYQPSPGLMSLIVECIGGGGAGGAADATQTAENIWTGGGGASGGYSRTALPANLVAGQVSVTIGAGGDPTGVINFGNGTATSFGPFCVANGGGAGGASQAGSYGGGTGPIGTGDVTFYGAGGMAGPMMDIPTSEFVAAVGGIGGQIRGGNATVNTGKGSALPGDNAYANSGAGGQGACINQLLTAVNTFGGAGGSGVCIITEYLWADLASGGASADCGQARVAIGAECFDPQGWMR